MPQLQGPLPTLIHSSRQLSIPVSKNWLSSYNTHAQSHPHLHPNSTFTPERLEFSSHGPTGGITLHLLSRIERGLAGEVLEPLKEDPESDDRVLDSQISPKKDGKSKSKKDAGKEGTAKRKFADLTTESEWEDPDQYALEQGEQDDIGEIGDRHNFVQAVDEEPTVFEHEDAKRAKTVEQRKQEKKEAKKARLKAEKREKAEAKKKYKVEHREDEEYI
jgi:hypothetical protein